MIDIKTGVRYFTYDEFDRLTRFTDGSTTITYTYYSDGTRASKQVSGANEFKYVYDREDIMVEYEHISGTDTYTRRYTHGPGIDNPAKLHLEQGATDKDFAYHLDALGSVRLLSDASKDAAVSYTYLPYGESTLTSGTDADAQANRYRFTAREFEQAHFSYYRSRYYVNRMGRFLKKDTYRPDYERPLSLNRYVYVEGNPILHPDPYGLVIVCPNPPCPKLWNCTNNFCNCSVGCRGPESNVLQNSIYFLGWLQFCYWYEMLDKDNDGWIEAISLHAVFASNSNSELKLCATGNYQFDKIIGGASVGSFITPDKNPWEWENYPFPNQLPLTIGICYITGGQQAKFDDLHLTYNIYNFCKRGNPPASFNTDDSGRFISLKNFVNEGYAGPKPPFNIKGFECDPVIYPNVTN